MNKLCFKCTKTKNVNEFYKHPFTTDGYLGKCKDCTKEDASKRTIESDCLSCKTKFMTWPTEIKRGGGKLCSRSCYYKFQKENVKKDELSPNWRGDDVGRTGLHNWVERKLGKPMVCEHCKLEGKKKYEWANKSQKYLRELSDWMRLCTKCHALYDRETRTKKWKLAVEKLGWKVTKIK